MVGAECQLVFLASCNVDILAACNVGWFEVLHNFGMVCDCIEGLCEVELCDWDCVMELCDCDWDCVMDLWECLILCLGWWKYVLGVSSK